MQILIVDDDHYSTALVKAALTPCGYELLTAASGAEALELLHKNPSCRVLISDLDMPVMDGIALCRAVRAQAFQGYVYVILLTGHSEHDHKMTALEAGADEFLAKPFDRAELVVRVRAAERISRSKPGMWLSWPWPNWPNRAIPIPVPTWSGCNAIPDCSPVSWPSGNLTAGISILNTSA